jgi:hypothetical protein
MEPKLWRRSQCAKQVFDRHAGTVVRVDEARVDDPISTDDEGGGNREHPILGPLRC